VTDPIRLVVADDHPLFRKGIVTMLQAVGGFEVVGEAETGEKAVALTREARPDVVLMDLHMPDMGGIAATREIRAFDPSVRVLVITMLEDDDSVFLSLRAGAQGYVLKGAVEDDFIRAIRAVSAGEAIFSPAIARRVLSWFESRQLREPDELAHLTHREREILDELALGNSNAAIARHLNLSSKTVANHLSSIFGKLQVADRGEAIVRARDAGFGRNP
jgi:DNA-binding NarL/FixJ family response regulator